MEKRKTCGECGTKMSEFICSDPNKLGYYECHCCGRKETTFGSVIEKGNGTKPEPQKDKICSHCGKPLNGNGFCNSCGDDKGEVEKADNGLTVGEHYENLLDKDKIFDLDTIFKDTWAGPKYTIEYKTTKGGKGTFYFNSIKKLFETLKVQYKTSLLDRVEAELPTFRFYCRYYSDLTDDMVGCIANENGHCNNDECKAIAEVKKAISKIRGLDK